MFHHISDALTFVDLNNISSLEGENIPSESSGK